MFKGWMMIEEQTAIVYYSPSRGRRYLSKRAAIRAEAVALISKKHPADDDWFWLRDMPRAEKLLRRVVRLVKKSMCHPTP